MVNYISIFGLVGDFDGERTNLPTRDMFFPFIILSSLSLSFLCCISFVPGSDQLLMMILQILSQILSA